MYLAKKKIEWYLEIKQEDGGHLKIWNGKKFHSTVW
jgi:hypothetical protein